MKEKATPSLVGDFYEELTCAALNAEISKNHEWDLDTLGNDSRRIEVKACNRRYWKILINQIDNDPLLIKKWFVFWKWRGTNERLCDRFRNKNELWKYLSWNTEYGIVIPALLIKQVLKSTSVSSSFLYRSPGNFRDHYKLTKSTLGKMLNDHEPRWIGVNRTKYKRSEKLITLNFKDYTVPTHLHFIVNVHPFKEELEEAPF